MQNDTNRKLLEEKLAHQDRKLVNDINHYGLRVISILEDDKYPAYSFSIGLFDNFQHPEIILIGLPQKLAQIIINNIAEDIKKGKKYNADREYDNILEGYKCYFKKMNPKYYKDYLGWAIWYYDGYNFPVIQCVYPDKNHNYPWNEKFKLTEKRHQPILG